MKKAAIYVRLYLRSAISKLSSVVRGLLGDAGHLPKNNLDGRRILFATSHLYPPDVAGGSESSTHELCEALSSNGYRTAVLASRHPACFLRTLRNGSSSTSSSWPKSYPVYRRRWPAAALTQTMRDFGGETVILHPDRDLMLALAHSPYPVIVYHRDTEFYRFSPASLHASNFLHVANSNFVKRELTRQFGIVPVVIRPLVSPWRYKTDVSKADEVLFVNPVQKKGVEKALAIAELCPELKFRFIAAWQVSDMERQSLCEKVEQTDNVTLVSHVSDMKAVYAKARVLIVPSQWEEAWGRVVTEAQLSGIPVVASKVGGLPESVGDGGVTLTKDSGAQIWAAEIRRLFTDHEYFLQLSQRAQRRTMESDVIPKQIVMDLMRVVSGELSHSLVDDQQPVAR